MPIVQTAKVDTYLLSICLHFNYHLLERKKTPTPIINVRFFLEKFFHVIFIDVIHSHYFIAFTALFLYSWYITRYTFLHIGLQSSRFTMHWYFFIIMEIEYGVGWLSIGNHAMSELSVRFNSMNQYLWVLNVHFARSSCKHQFLPSYYCCGMQDVLAK